MEKIMFLDIDGVIATNESVVGGQWALVNARQVQLRKIIEATGCKIVLSSSWRKWDLETTRQFMKEEGFWFWDLIIGITIRAYQYLDRTNKIHLSGPTVRPNTYAGEFAGKYIAASLLSGETLAKELITLHPNVAYKQVIRNWQNSVVVADASCDFTDSSSVTWCEYVLTTVEKQVNLQLCKYNLRTS